MAKGPFESFREAEAQRRVEFEMFRALDEYLLILVRLRIEDVTYYEPISGGISSMGEWVFGGGESHHYGSQDLRECVQRVKGRV
jgi:hypothetical protein